MTQRLLIVLDVNVMNYIWNVNESGHRVTWWVCFSVCSSHGTSHVTCTSSFCHRPSCGSCGNVPTLAKLRWELLLLFLWSSHSASPTLANWTHCCCCTWSKSHCITCYVSQLMIILISLLFIALC
jgi:hypothetical protein